ncbi:LysR family transcriptional regulator [Diaphorobacter sp. HDW4A]|uniref:LysR family transcriptional regulator n=1 Tax=Diaphorobacter sp. HDW4A TaxID=2714924 RepID=UPI00140C6302|nr:LysR substrate-binding domain-containing protein [Diaphorobacter sp. HDW4A]QIL82970.1 LysR family transcriptional regulator [Diaphorobacter sp. HDW4A]
MQLKWLEDFITLAKERSFTRAAELRHVTHPAFGRRIRALEAWAGTPLVAQGSGPVRLTPAGEAFLETAEQLTRNLTESRAELQTIAGRHARSVTLATGRTLARTVVADWLMRVRTLLLDGELHILTDSLEETVKALQHGDADFAVLFHHPALVVPLDARQYSHATIASDKLVALSQALTSGEPRHAFNLNAPTPYVAYARSLALGRLVEDHLAHHPAAPKLQRLMECDSPDAHHEYVLKGLGMSWLPWSLAHADVKAGRLARAGDKRMDIRFDVRVYRPKRKLSALAESMWGELAKP